MATTEIEKFKKLQMEVEDLQKQLSFLNKNKIPELENKIQQNNSEGENSGSTDDSGNTETPATSTWEVVYDMSSEDSAINLGYTSGIMGKSYYISGLPDLNNYRYMKTTTYCMGTRQRNIFDLSIFGTVEKRTILMTEDTLYYLGSISFLFVIDSDIKKLWVGKSYLVTLKTTAYLSAKSLTSENTNTVRIEKIELLK